MDERTFPQKKKKNLPLNVNVYKIHMFFEIQISLQTPQFFLNKPAKVTVKTPVAKS